MLRIYGSAKSRTLRTLWMVSELGLAYEQKDWLPRAPETRTPEFLTLNPAGQVPVAVLADGRVLTQSNAIMLHLAEGSHLVPNDGYERAKMFEWLFREQYSHEPSIAVRIARLFYRRMREEDLDPALLTKGNAALARMELQLARTLYLVGERLTLADIALVAYTRMAHRGGFDLAAYPSVMAWISRMEADLGLENAATA